MLRRAPLLAHWTWLFGAVLTVNFCAHSAPSLAAGTNYEAAFTNTVRPFLESYCEDCHSGDNPKGELDLSIYKSTATVVRDYSRWTVALEKLSEKEMPPAKSKHHPTAEEREAVIAWVDAVCRAEARRHAGDP